MSYELGHERYSRARAAGLGYDWHRDGAWAVGDGDSGGLLHIVGLSGVDELGGIGAVGLKLVNNGGCVLDRGSGALPIGPCLRWVIA